MKLPYSVIAVFLLALLAGCKQDFDVTADYKEIPVVYGLLNQQDNKHYIRIQKAYLIDGNALVAAGVADSIYYPDVLTVKLTAYNSNGTVSGTPFTLTRVDGDSIGLPKEPGAFSQHPNWLYTFNGTLDPSKYYRLEVTNNSNGAKFSSKKDGANKDITLVDDFHISNPAYGTKLNLQNTNPAKIVWTTAEGAGIYDVTVRFHYKEYAQSDNTLLRDTFIDIPVLKSYTYDYTGGSVNPAPEMTADILLGYLASHLIASTDVYREFNVKKGMKFKFAAGGTELEKFVSSQLAQGGLASNEALPPYTNIDGGVGLLSSRYFKQVDSVLLTNNGLDSLACSDISKALRFKNHNGFVCQ